MAANWAPKETARQKERERERDTQSVVWARVWGQLIDSTALSSVSETVCLVFRRSSSGAAQLPEGKREKLH